MHPSVCRTLEHIEFWMYVGPPNGTAFAQGCDKAEINQRFGQQAACGEFFSEWLAPIVEALGDKDKVPSTPRHLMAKWIKDAREMIFEGDIKAATHAAYFSDALAFAKLLDTEYSGEASSDSSDSDSEHLISGRY